MSREIGKTGAGYFQPADFVLHRLCQKKICAESWPNCRINDKIVGKNKKMIDRFAAAQYNI